MSKRFVVDWNRIRTTCEDVESARDVMSEEVHYLLECINHLNSRVLDLERELDEELGVDPGNPSTNINHGEIIV